MASHFVYIVKCRDGTYYTGYTTDVNRRLDTHNKGKGAKYTRSRLPVDLVFSQSWPTKREAMQEEARIKRLTRQQKEAIIRKGSRLCGNNEATNAQMTVAEPSISSQHQSET